MNQIAVDKTLCRKDGVCVDVCGSRTLTMDEDGFPVEDPEQTCILCGHCLAVCAAGALTHAGLPGEPLLPMPTELPSAAAMEGLLISRRSVRTFRNKPVSQETLEALLQVARRAPTAHNSQLLQWIVVNGQEKVHALAEIMASAVRGIEGFQGMLKLWDTGYDFFLRNAPTVVVAYAPADYPWEKTDGAIALTYLELAAEARKLGVCWAGLLTHITAQDARLRQALHLPEGCVVSGALMLGEPHYKFRKVPPRKPLSVQWL